MNFKEDWQSSLYDQYLIDSSINSKIFHQMAKGEVKFLCETLKITSHTKILDIPCGTGRHTRLLARKGAQVTGVDLNPKCLELAAQNCRGLKLHLGQSNMSDLGKYYDQFDIVLNLFTSFGYFSTELKNKKILLEFIKCLRPGGLLVIHFICQFWFLKNFSKNSVIEDEYRVQKETRFFDHNTKVNHTQIDWEDKASGEKGVQYFSIRIYSADEMMLLMQEAGLEEIKVFGNFKADEYQEGLSSHPIVIGRKNKIKVH